MKNNSFIAVLICFLCGNFAAVFVPVMPPIIISVLGVTIVFVVIVILFLKLTMRLYLTVFLLGFFVFCLRISLFLDKRPTNDQTAQIATMDVTVKGFSKRNLKSQRFKVVVNSVLSKKDSAQSSQFNSWSGMMMNLTCYQCEQQFSLGERWKLQLRLRKVYGSASWGVFDFERWALSNKLIAQGSIIDLDSALKLAEPNWLDKKRADIRSTIISADIRPYSKAVVNALAIGDRSLFDAKLWQFLKATGLGHIVAISGLHVGFVFVLFVFLSRCIFNRFYLIYKKIPAQVLCSSLALLATYFYCLLAGFSIPTQRAFLMLLMFCLMQLSLKEIGGFKILLFAFALIVIADPSSLLSLSLWMSVLAVLMVLSVLHAKPRAPLLNIQFTLSFGMGFLSLILIGNASLISPLVNLIVVPLVGFIVLPVVLIIVLAVLFGRLDAAIFLLERFDRVGLGIFGYLPSKWYEPNFVMIEPKSVSYIASLGLIIAVAVWVVRQRLLLLRSFCLIALICLFINTKEKLKEGEFYLTVLDVGQALAIVIETQESTVIYDTGNRYETSDSAVTTVIPYLRYQGINSIDHLLVSHHDADHIGGAQSLLESMPIKHVWSHATLPRYIDLGEKPLSICSIGKKWQLSGVNFEIIYSGSKQVGLSNFHSGAKLFNKLADDMAFPLETLSENNKSCVIRVESPFGSVLIAGDIERSVEHLMVNQYWKSSGEVKSLESDVLILAHHGSKTSSTPSFLDLVKPGLGISSAAYMSHHGHPHKIVRDRLLKRGIKHINTAESGSIQLKFLENGVDVIEYRKRYPRFWRW